MTYCMLEEINVYNSVNKMFKQYKMITHQNPFVKSLSINNFKYFLPIYITPKTKP